MHNKAIYLYIDYLMCCLSFVYQQGVVVSMLVNLVWPHVIMVTCLCVAVIVMLAVN